MDPSSILKSITTSTTPAMPPKKAPKPPAPNALETRTIKFCAAIFECQYAHADKISVCRHLPMHTHPQTSLTADRLTSSN